MKKIVLYNPETSQLENKKDKILSNAKDAICLGITSMTGHQIEDGLKIARIVKKNFPNIPVIWGGWHPTILSVQTLKNPYVDVVIRGQGERTFAELVDALEKKKPLKDVLGVGYKKNSKIIINKERPFEDVNNFPPLPYHLLNVENHIVHTQLCSRTIHYTSSQGCPHRCAFCAESQVYKRFWSGLKAERIVKEIKNLAEKYKINAVIFTDTNFFVSEKRVIEFCEGLLKEGVKIKWCEANGRTKQLLMYKRATWDLMKKAGLFSILVGAESAQQEKLDLIKKDTTVKDSYDLAKLCKEYQIKIMFSLMIGFPPKDEEEKRNYKKDLKKELDSIIKFVDYLIKLNKNNIYLLFVYTPYPGTELYYLSLKNGLKAPQRLEDWSRFEQTMKTTPWVPERYANLTEQFNLLYFPFLTDSIYELIKDYKFAWIYKILWYILHLDLLIRWRLRFFYLPIEYFILKR